MKAENEIAKEYVIAQRQYNKLTTHRPIPRLHKPSVYIPCRQAKMLNKLEEMEEDHNVQQEETKCDVNVSVENKLTTQSDESNGNVVQKFCECIVKFKDKRLEQEELEVEEIMPVRTKKNTLENPLSKIDEGKNITIENASFSQCKCKYLIEKQLKTESCVGEKKELPSFVISGLKETDVNEKVIPIIEGVKSVDCDCLTKYQMKSAKYEEYKARHDLVEEMCSLSQKFIVGGVCMGAQNKPVFTILGIYIDLFF